MRCRRSRSPCTTSEVMCSSKNSISSSLNWYTSRSGPSSIRVRGIGRRSANPPYSTLCATLLAAEATWSGFGIRSMGEG